MTRNRLNRIPLPYVQTKFEKAFGLFNGEIQGRDRTSQIAQVRQLFSFYAWNRGYTLLEIADYLKQDHTTVMHSRDTSEARLRTYPQLNERYFKLIEEVENEWQTQRMIKQ
jgi:chromosomal replication initiation ATPase DnaA